MLQLKKQAPLTKILWNYHPVLLQNFQGWEFMYIYIWHINAMLGIIFLPNPNAAETHMQKLVQMYTFIVLYQCYEVQTA
jgi:hypothetical protein